MLQLHLDTVAIYCILMASPISAAAVSVTEIGNTTTCNS